MLIVEKEPSIGGKMIGLSKVFPTFGLLQLHLHAPNGRGRTSSEYPDHDVQPTCVTLSARTAQFAVRVVKKPRYVAEDRCTGCRLCEYACNTELPHEFEGNLGVRKAIYVPFGNAAPQVALLDVENCVLCGELRESLPHGCRRLSARTGGDDRSSRRGHHQRRDTR